MIKDPIDLTKKLIKIESVSGNEKELGIFIHDYLRSLGFKPRFQKITNNRSNVIIDGNSDIQINGHLDTVAIGDEWKHKQGEVSNGKLYGRGACDIKSSIGSVLAALAKNPTDKINLSFVVGEEDTFIGVKQLKPKKYVIELEPTENRLIYCHKGQLRLKVTAYGKAAHASVPEQGENAILKLNEAITKISSSKFSANHNILGKPTINIGKINGGTASNIVPDKAEMMIDRRVLPNEDISKVVKFYQNLLKSLSVEVDGLFKPAEFDNNSYIIQKMQKILKKFNMNTNPTGVLFTTQLGEMKNVQGVVFGPGSVKQAHKIDEFVQINEVEMAYNIFCELFKSLNYNSS